MIISELLKGLKVKRKKIPIDVEIKGIAYDSRLIDKGFLFVAIKGFSADGHDYIKDAISRGAAAVVTDEAVESKIAEQLAILNKLAHIVVTESRRALAFLSSAFYGEPAKSLSLIGITGTNGKTTTSYITKNILEARGKNVGLIGTIQYIIGDDTIKPSHTTPESLDLQRHLREMLDNKVEYAVLEVSSHALALDRVERCSFKIAAFTNFSHDHLDFHGTMEEYFRAKSKLFTYLGTDGCVVLNWDDPKVRSLTQELNCKVITCGIEEGAMLRAVNIRTQSTDYRRGDRKPATRNGLSFEIQTPEDTFRVKSNFIGRFNVYNILMSAAIAYALGISKEIIQRGIQEAGPVEGRFERVDEGQGFLCIVDYAHTEDALEKLIQEARLITKGRVITVFGCGGDRDRTKRPAMGAVATELSDLVIITSDNSRTEEPLEIIKDIVRGVKKSNYTLQPDRAKAIREAVSMAKEGDTLLVAGKGHEDYQEIKGVRYPFNDKKILREAIQKIWRF